MSQLIKSLAKSYRKRGWKVFTGTLDEFENIPATWVGPKPDILVIRDKDIVAVCIENTTTLNYSNIVEKWRSIVKNGAKLSIAIKEPETLEQVKHLAERNSVPLTIQLMKKTHRRVQQPPFKSTWKSPRIDVLMISLVVIVVLAVSVMFLPGLLSKFRLKSFYSPKDRERQVEILKQRETEDTGKSQAEKQDRRRKDLDLKKDFDKLQEKYNSK
jgi:hypothetical protein